MTLTRTVIAAGLLALSAPAAAQGSSELVEAQRSGLVGERYDGYLGFPAGVRSDVRRQAGAVNIRRRSLYTALAQRRGATVQEVGIAAGCELLAGVKVGESYLLNDNVWRVRAAGQPAPAPAYCAR